MICIRNIYTRVTVIGPDLGFIELLPGSSTFINMKQKMIKQTISLKKKKKNGMRYSRTNCLQAKRIGNDSSTCWKPGCHAYLPMGFKYRESSKPPSCGLLLQVSIAPSIYGSCTVLPTCSLYNFCIICPVKLINVKNNLKIHDVKIQMLNFSYSCLPSNRILAKSNS